MNEAVEDRAIGPAIVEDLLAAVTHENGRQMSTRLTRAIISYIFPQLEGVPKREQIVKQIAAVDTELDQTLLREAAREMLQIPLATDE
jgi:hypothetical protein